MQSVPFAASYVFGELEVSKPEGRHRAKKDDVKKEKNRKKKGDDDYVSAIAKSLAQDVDDTISTMKMPRKKIESCEKIQSLS